MIEEVCSFLAQRFLFVWAIFVVLVQVFWQAVAGWTIGKVLVGIRVLRSTGRNCGLTRSLLREVLLMFDSVFLLCWIPGILEIKLSARSQRVGDNWADTIVVRQQFNQTMPGSFVQL